MYKLLVIALLASQSLAAQTLPDSVALRVVLIRHGEKPAKGDNLDCQGFNRSKKLPAVLYQQFGKPDFTFVPTIVAGKKGTSPVRMFQTVSPFAIQYNLPINSQYAVGSVSQLAGAIKNCQGTVLVVWEHKHIPLIAGALGLANPPGWEGGDFDSIWILDFAKTATGGLGTLNFTKGAENINPSKDCK